MEWKLLASTFGLIFLAELGDKTQLAAILLAAKTQKPWTVFLGASLALVVISAIGVAFAAVISQFVPETVIRKVAAGAFVLLGLLIWFNRV
jgi:putative Ca2+/H+ antiporter (TMEM165/GDT1 family)